MKEFKNKNKKMMKVIRMIKGLIQIFQEIMIEVIKFRGEVKEKKQEVKHLRKE
jgi:t-SNARE complex subunit (syntaxin)